MVKAACAADAIGEGILDLFGNGQTTPAEKRLFDPQEDDATFTAQPVALTLIQSARGGKFGHKFLWTTDTKRKSTFVLFYFPLRPAF